MMFGGEVLGVCGRRRVVSEITCLQLGGMAEDALYDIQPLSSGEFILMGRTKSQTFCGQDISAYTDGSSYYAWFFIKIDINEPVNWYKGGYFLTGNGYTLGFTAGDYPQIELDSSENILYAYGASAGGAGWKIYAISPSTMTLSMTADTAISVNCASPEAYVRFKHYGGSTYVCYANGTSMYGQTLNSSLVQTATATIVSSKTPKHMAINASYIFILTYDLIIYRLNLSWGSATTHSVAASFTVSGCEVIACDAGTNLYVAGIKAGDNDLLVRALTQATFAVPSGWTDYVKSISSGKIIRYRGLGLCDGRLLVAGLTNDGATGIYDVGVVEINASTGAGVTDEWISDSSGASIAQSGKVFNTHNKPPRELSSSRLVIGGATDGYAPGQSNIGGYDVWVMIVDYTGKQC